MWPVEIKMKREELQAHLARIVKFQEQEDATWKAFLAKRAKEEES